MANSGFGLPKRMVMVKIADFCRSAKIPHPFKDGPAGERWYRGFKKRHPELTHRTPSKFCTNRGKAMQQEVIAEYFKVVAHHCTDVDASCMWNMDESGFQFEHATVQVICKKVTKSLNSRVSSSRENVTFIACGFFMPPMFIAKGKTVKSLNSFATTDAPPGSRWTWQTKAWMEDSLGVEWFTNVFLKFCGPQRPQILILDQHHSHEAYEFIEMARENQITVLALPPHTSQWLQPLDKGCFSSLSSSYRRICHEFMASVIFHVVNKSSFTRLFCQAWERSMTPSNVRVGFRITGLHPFNPAVIPEHAFSITSSATLPSPPPAPSATLPPPPTTAPSTFPTPASTLPPPASNLPPPASTLPSLSAPPSTLSASSSTLPPPASTLPSLSAPPSTLSLSPSLGIQRPTSTPKRAPIVHHRVLTSDEVFHHKKAEKEEKERKVKEVEEKKKAREEAKKKKAELPAGGPKPKRAKRAIAPKSKKSTSAVSRDKCVCFTSTPGEWVQCDLCDRWMHQMHHQMSQCIVHDWLCRLCPALEGVTSQRLKNRLQKTWAKAASLTDLHSLEQYISAELSRLGLNKLTLHNPDLFLLRHHQITNAVVVELETYRNHCKLKPTFTIDWLARLCPTQNLAVLSKGLKGIVKDYNLKLSNKARHPDDYTNFTSTPFPAIDTSAIPVPSTSAPGRPCGPSQQHFNILKQKCLDAEQELENCKEQNQLLTEELKKAKVSESSLATKNKNLVAKNSEILNERTQLLNKIQLLEEVNTNTKKSALYEKNRKLRRSVAELSRTENENSKKIESLREEKIKAQKVASRLKKEVSSLKKQVEERQSMSQFYEGDAENSRLFHDSVCNRFSSDMRKTILALQGEGNVAASKCSTVIKIVSTHLFKRKVTESVQTQTCLNIASEGQALSKFQMASEILHSKGVVLHSDATSRDKRKYLGQQVT
ncbi:jerky protein [Elysia marginata]|uniref:Jerky protein n=1 Tax=Elysia marginata TaxID=1093978 RepID=A0AAV4GST3_9GAST|nr:jerky protein [Elysia marginata]